MESVLRLIMVLVGFSLALLGVIIFIHSSHQVLGLLIAFGGLLSTFGGLPKYE